MYMLIKARILKKQGDLQEAINSLNTAMTLPGVRTGSGKHICSFYGLKSAKIVKIWNSLYKSAPKGPIPLSNFYKIWRGDGIPGPHPHATSYHCCFKNVGL